jgi:hypothetical protein
VGRGGIARWRTKCDAISGTFEHAIDIARRALEQHPKIGALPRSRRILWPHQLAAKKVRRAEKYRRLVQECLEFMPY